MSQIGEEYAVRLGFAWFNGFDIVSAWLVTSLLREVKVQ